MVKKISIIKKVFVSILASILLILPFVLSACSNDGNGTYYPDVKEMAANLNNSGYLTQFATGERNSEGRDWVVDSLSATKGEDYIVFYRIEESAHCDIYCDKLRELHPDCPHYVTIENDEKFGNIVYCGTENAIKAAGIRVVKVKV